MSQKIEIERKWLIEAPTSWSQIEELLENIVDVRRITQTYLQPKDNQPSGRVRKIVEGLSGESKIIYEYNEKKFVSAGVHEEREREISKVEYEKHLQHHHPNKDTIEKTRFIFKDHNQIFELDLFKNKLNGLAILELELKTKDQKVNLPTFLKIIKEITEDKKYNNFELANKALLNKL